MIREIYPEDNGYPLYLKLIPSYPKKLYYIGDEKLFQTKAVAIVGTRNASEYGKEVAYQIAKLLVENNVTVVSGMAIGIDAAAHRGAVENGGKTVAVLGSGVDVIYPYQNRKLYEEICETGLVISENKPGTEPRSFLFPNRNRIISGLSFATIVVEAGIRSGSTITARFASEQGRAVYAIPGNINRQYSVGTNKLIQDGVSPVISLNGLISDLGLNNLAISEKEKKLGEDEKKVYLIIKREGEITASLIANELKKELSFVLGIISVLEMKGFIGTEFGKVFCL
ncbi:MAG: DNA-processing protein DprA [Clostridiales Family XIII bacterium]|jgi:DNA processing protein|nr:DNA-processing protein DprA [Clostridiales Family XIII bacterium]